MSTELQTYSTDNQQAEIRRYADERGFELVRTYADEGKSGLDLAGRLGLQQLLRDVAEGQADFEALLVYDVSRWGRFQDPDEAASIELQCRRAGIAVHYCAEQFENDGSLSSSIMKTLKRAMAAEYSRELSAKVFAGKANLIRRGFRQGGLAGYGLRRMLLDEFGEPRFELKRSQRKCIATDRVVLVPGPPSEVAVVREIFELFADGGKGETEIASMLNARGILTASDRPWTLTSVSGVLENEKYVGNNVWHRTTQKLKQKHQHVAPDLWVRSDGAFQAIVDRTTFDRAQAIRRSRNHVTMSDEEMLDALRKLLREHGHLTAGLITATKGVPSSACYQDRFGSIMDAYARIGHKPGQYWRNYEVELERKKLHADILADVISRIEQNGGRVDYDQKWQYLTINEEFTAAICIVRCSRTRKRGALRWRKRFKSELRADLTVIVRMDPENRFPLDYYLLPRAETGRVEMTLREHNGARLDAFRSATLDPLYDMTGQVPPELALW